MDCRACEPSLGEALADPMVRALMRADGVDARKLENDLFALSRTLEKRNRAGSGLPARRICDC